MAILLRLLVAFILITGVSLPAFSTQQPIRVTIVYPEGVEARGAEVVARPVGGEERRIIPVENGEVLVGDPGEVEWELELLAPGWWSPKRLVSAAGAGGAFDLRAYQLATLKGRVRVSSGALPDRLRVVVESVPEPQRPPEIAAGTEFPCDLLTGGYFNCSIPSAKIDIALRADDFASYYLWDVVAGPAAVHDLGVVPMTRGGSISAWIDETQLNASDPPSASLFMVSSNAASPETARLRVPVAHAKVSSRGLVQLQGLRPGRYVLHLEASGYASTQVSPLEVFEASETRLRKLIRLRDPVTIAVNVTPPTDPSGAPWAVHARRRNEFSAAFDVSAPLTGQTDEVGRLVFQNQPPGMYRIRVAAANGTRMAASEERIFEGENAEVFMRVDLQPIEGTVTLGDNPLVAKLWFGTKSGAVRVPVISDEDGHFRIHLPRVGRWPVDIEAEGEGVAASIEVLVERETPLEIHLPSTEISGRVVGDDHTPSEGADVLITEPGGRRRATSGPGGEYRVRGIPPGEVTVRATDRRTRQESKRLSLILAQDEKKHDVDLQLQANKLVSGRVLVQGEGVAGAVVTAYEFDGGRASSRQTTTDLAGNFDFEVPETATSAVFLVAAPMRLFKPFRAGLESDNLILALEGSGGRLHMKWPAVSYLEIKFEGVRLPSRDLLEWARGYGQQATPGEMHLPYMAPGRYEVCIIRVDEETVECRDGAVLPGLTAEIAFSRD